MQKSTPTWRNEISPNNIVRTQQSDQLQLVLEQAVQSQYHSEAILLGWDFVSHQSFKFEIELIGRKRGATSFWNDVNHISCATSFRPYDVRVAQKRTVPSARQPECDVSTFASLIASAKKKRCLKLEVMIAITLWSMCSIAETLNLGNNLMTRLHGIIKKLAKEASFEWMPSRAEILWRQIVGCASSKTLTKNLLHIWGVSFNSAF